MSESWKQYFGGLLNLIEEKRADITDRPGLIVSVIEKVNGNNRSSEIEKALK